MPKAATTYAALLVCLAASSRGADDFSKYVAADIAKWEKVIKVSGAKPDQ